ncbi:hypothetical protein MesoLjLa_63910 (plasmid) [Mesorhizobium sp. L-2-11]|nr:hypothetical protein MesoLjLa_63910 [Mesorhizobium sp. L-2-11]
MGAPPIHTVEAGDGTIPGSSRDALSDLRTAPNPVIGKDVLPTSLPYGLGAGFRKKADPDKDIIAVGTKGMVRANAVERQVAEETIQIRIVERPVPEDHWDMGVKALR